VYQRWPSFLCLIAAVSAAGTGACTEANPAYRKAGPFRGDGGLPGPDVFSGPPGRDADPVSPREVGGEDQAPETDGPKEPLPPSNVLGPDLPVVDTRPPEAPPADTATPDPAPPDAADPRPTQGLLVAFSLENEASTKIGNDYSETDAYGNTLLTHGLVYATDVPPGAPAGSKSLQFDGVSGYANLTLKVAPRNDAAKTIAVWFKSTTGTPSPRTLVSLAALPETTNVGIQLGFDGDQLACWRYGQNPEFSGPAARNTWQHATYTYSGNTAGSIHRLYVDGQMVGMGSAAMSGTKVLDRAFLGTYDPPDEMFKGYIKDLRIYDHALTDAEILTLARQP
jgi:hypothetical protein